jgi:preprotein translocase subunit SecB
MAMGLNSFSCQLDRSAYLELRRKKQTPSRKITVSFEVTEVKPTYFDAIAKYALTEHNGQRKSRSLSIECVFGTHFHAPEPIDKGLAERFVNSFVGVLLWPYFRQFVIDSTARMAIRPITLPLLPER